MVIMDELWWVDGILLGRMKNSKTKLMMEYAKALP